MSEPARSSARTNASNPEPRVNSPPPVLTDRILLERVENALHASPYLPLRALKCYVHERVVIVRGQVPTYYCKQLAQTLINELAGVDEVNNQIEVVGPGTKS